MKRLITLTLVVIGITATTLVVAQTPRSIEAQFKAAQHKEEVEGDLKGAIEEYIRIARGSDRAVAAKALLRVADCYRRLGDSEARAVYERIVREYTDQPQALVEARNRLVEIGTAEKSADTHVVARQIWVGDDVNVEGTPSADGKLLTYIDYKSTNSGNVAIRDLTTGKNKRLTNATLADGYAYEPVISPNAKQVAYVWWDGGGIGTIRTIGIEGGQTRAVTRLNREGVNYLRWSPDGRHLAATLHNVDDRTWRIVLIAVADGSTTTLKSMEWRESVLGGFSPDGRYLVYAVPKLVSTTDNGIYSIAVDGSRESTLVRGPAEDMWPVWTPDGRAVVFLSDRSGTQDLWSVAVVEGKPRGEPMLVRGGVGNIVNMGFTRDGDYFYGTRNLTRDVYVAEMNGDTLELRTELRRLSDQYVGSNMAPSWSPDGRFLAFVRGADRLKRSIVLRSLIDGSERTLPFKIADGIAVGASGVTWLPDGRSILVPEADYTKRISTIHKIDVESGHSEAILQDRFGKLQFRFAASPDGRIIYFTRSEVGSGARRLLRLIKKDVSSGSETELYQAESNGVAFFSPAVSPDGDLLSFTVNVGDKGDRHLVVVPTVGGPARVVFRGDYRHPSPHMGVWSKDGKYVLAAAEETKSLFRVWAFPVDGGEPRKLDIVFEGIAAAHLSHDGKQFAFTGTQTNGEVWTIKNLLPRP
jgi:Tol biopolymer transport system component